MPVVEFAVVPDDFNPRSPDGERPCSSVTGLRLRPVFQSTLPGWGATLDVVGIANDLVKFQSTLPGWGATWR